MFKEISLSEFYGYLESGSGVLLDYDSDRFAGLTEEGFAFYRDGDMLLMKEYEDGKYSAYAWLTRDVDYGEAFGELIADESCTELALSACGFLHSGIVTHFGGLAFSRRAEECRDEGVVLLGEKDVPAMLAFCQRLSGGGFFDKDEAQTFEYIAKEGLFTTFGIYDGGELAGMVFYRAVPKKRLGVLSELAVLPEYRRRGYAKRLVYKALGACPDYNYIYTCHKQNYASMALADDCGFKFCGVKNFMLKTAE